MAGVDGQLGQDPAQRLPAKPGLAGKRDGRDGGLRQLPPLFFSGLPVALFALVRLGQHDEHGHAPVDAERDLGVTAGPEDRAGAGVRVEQLGRGNVREDSTKVSVL